MPPQTPLRPGVPSPPVPHLRWFVPTFPDQSRLGDPATLVAPSLEHLTRVARSAEAAGFEGMLVPTGEGCLAA